MILIISSPSDISTSAIIDWLLYYKVDFLRISEEDIWKYNSIHIENGKTTICFEINKKQYTIDDFSCIWYRRSFINVANTIKVPKNILFTKSIYRHLTEEIQVIHNFTIASNNNKFVINKISDNRLNKLTALYLAQKVGLLIPETIITTKKSDVKKFIRKHKNIITKNISPGVFISTKNHVLKGTTELVTPEIYQSIPDIFAFSLFQELVPKWIELRIFFIQNQYYTTAIFSQSDEQTKIDFRNYNYEKPNRTPPFSLPKNIMKKLNVLMNKLGLHSGSIDMILTPNDEFVFLEVNPIGLFTQVSLPANFYLEKVLATTLKRIDDEKQKEQKFI